MTEPRPTYRAIENDDLGTVYRTSDGSTFLTEDHARLYADAEPCPECEDKHPDYRSAFGHLEMDPATGATILAAHVR